MPLAVPSKHRIANFTTNDDTASPTTDSADAIILHIHNGRMLSFRDLNKVACRHLEETCSIFMMKAKAGQCSVMHEVDT